MKEEETGHGDMTWVVAGGRRPWRDCGSGSRSSSSLRKEARKGLSCWGLEAKQRIEELKEAAANEREAEEAGMAPRFFEAGERAGDAVLWRGEGGRHGLLLHLRE